MNLKVAIPFKHQSTLVCDEAREMLKNAGFEILCNEGRDLSRDEQKEMIKDAFGIMAGVESYDADMLSACKSLRCVIRFGVGTDNFDLQKMKEMNVEVGVISNRNAVAEFTLTLMLAAVKNLILFDRTTRQGRWDRFTMTELAGKTIGIIGFGRIGKRLAELLKMFDATILVYDPYIEGSALKTGDDFRLVSFEELLAQSDIISVHAPSVKSTYHMINAETIGKMKDGVVLVNTSRGALIDETALYEALVSGKVRAAGIDVYEKEPITKENPLLTLDNVVVAPHAAALSYETNYNGGLISAKSIINVLNGGKPLYPLW